MRGLICYFSLDILDTLNQEKSTLSPTRMLLFLDPLVVGGHKMPYSHLFAVSFAHFVPLCTLSELKLNC